MSYVIKHADLPVLKFDIVENLADPVVEILWINQAKKKYLPIDLEVTDNGLASWLRKRTIPRNRAYVGNFLAKCGLSINRPLDIISVSKGLSLNDVYWVVEDDFEGSYSRYNLYENHFSQILALVAFTGYGSTVRSSLASSPEFTTNGNLRKCWRRIDGKVYLYKGATSGASNTGYEPYSEYYASEIAKTMGVNAIPYKLSKWKGQLCSSCQAFTSIKYSYVPIGRLVTSGGMKAVREYYKQLGRKYTAALDEMIVFDAIICNNDRHFGNFGLLVDNDTNQIAGPAPLFDHGNSLFNFAGREDLESKEVFEEYVNTLLPAAYDDFIGAAKDVMSDEISEKVRHLLDYKIKKNPRYNVPEGRYRLINWQVQKRARMVLEL